MVERVIDGQKRVFQHPKTADLTQKGQQILNELGGKNFEEYENLDHRELVEKIHTLEDRIDEKRAKVRDIPVTGSAATGVEALGVEVGYPDWLKVLNEFRGIE
jgi:predicted ATP-grasp superfamily ATP-dependent carboligase